MLCEVLSEFSQTVLPLPCNVYINVTSVHCHSDSVMLSQLPAPLLLLSGIGNFKVNR